MKRGSLFVETALFLPLFLAAMLLLISLIPLHSAGETVLYALCDEAERTMSAEESALALQIRLSVRTAEESGMVRGLWLTEYERELCVSGIEDCIRVALRYEVPLPFALSFIALPEVEENVLCRAFTGMDAKGEPCGHAWLERELGYEAVYVFPKYGERYHAADCQTIRSFAQQCFLTEDLRRRFAACETCRPAELPNGSVVFYFPLGGKAYHRSSCPQVEKTYVEMDLEEAVAQGYTSCGLCGR